jgi:o-succinylbenzoate synthase
MPLHGPWRIAVGESTSIETIVVKLRSGELEAWGEAAPHHLPEYAPEWAASVFLLLRDVLLPQVVGADVESAQDLHSLMARYRGNCFAKAALDTAWWSLEARGSSTSLAALLGAVRTRVEVGADFGIQASLDELVQQVQRAVDAGARRVKLKIRPGWDLDVVDAVRATFPSLTLHVDCNGAYALADAGLFRQLDAYALAMIEQPLAHDDLFDHATLQRQLETPICLDESISGVRQTRQAIELGSCRWVNIKPGRVGGLAPAVDIHDVCRDAGVGCWVGGMLESALGAGFCAVLAGLPGITYPSDIFPTERFFAEDLADPPISFDLTPAGWFACVDDVQRAPRPELLERWTVERATVPPHGCERV